MEDVIKKTQSELGAVIQAPKLTEKLLSRPPFRFIHDIVLAVLKAGSFPEHLFSDDQLDSAKVSDKKAKLAFLELLIAVVGAGTGKPVSARAAKIAAGEEPEKTNELLQDLAACAGLSAAKKQAAVQKVKGGGAEPLAAPVAPAAPAPTAKAPASPKPAANAPAQESEEERQKRHEEERRRRHEEKKREKEKEKEKAAKAAAAAEAAPAVGGDEAAKDADAERRQRREEKKRERDTAGAVAAAAEASASSAESPSAAAAAAAAGGNTTTSARKAPPRTKPTHEVIEAQRAADATPAAGVIREGKKRSGDRTAGSDGDDDDDAQDWQKVAAQYAAKPAVRTAAVAEDAEVKGLLGQQALKAKREQEAAARGVTGDDGGSGAASAAAASPTHDGIVIHNSRSTVSRGGGSHALSDSDLNQLREQLQMLTKASNPLGKFLEAIHDDIDSMTRELEMWRSESRSQALAASEARRQTEESLQEIHANLQNLEDAISDQMQKTNNLRQTILANDAAMETMMRTIVNPDLAAQ